MATLIRAPWRKPDSCMLNVIVPAPDGQPPRELFLVLPGLNLVPERLGPLRRFLLDRGYGVAEPFPEGYE